MRVYADIGPSTAEVLRLIGNGVMAHGMREALEVYRELWAMGYRPTVPVKWWVRQYGKKKGPRRAPKVSAMAPQYNPEQEG